MAEHEKLQERLRRMQKPVAGTPWWRRMVLPVGMLATGLAGGVYVATVQPSETAPPPSDAQVPVAVTTAAGDGRLVQCNLNLVVAPDKEEALKARLPQVRAAVSETLADTYQQTDRGPNIQGMPETLRQAINNKLPPGLKVREVLIQHLLFGLS